MKRIRYTCSHCHGPNVRWDAWASWDEEQQMVLENSFQDTFCEDCEGSCSVDEEEIVEPNEDQSP